MKEKIKAVIQNKEIMKRIVPVLVLMLVLIIGSTYAYFSINVSGGKTNTSISIETGKLNSIAITNKIPNIHINLKASDMSSTSLVTEFYATDKKEEPYTNEANKMLNIAEITVVGDIEVKNFCTADVTVAFTEGDTMGDELLEGDSELYIKAGDITETLDLSKIKTKRSQTYTANFEVEDSEPQAIQAYLKISNREADQSYLAEKELHLKIEINNFSCTTDVEAPTLANFYISEDKEGTKYTKQTQNTAYLSWQEDDVKEYCITKDKTNEKCEWETVQEGKNITKQITLDTPDGEKRLYAYLKDKANNISDSFMDKITLDTTPPTISDVTSTEITQTSIAVSVTGSDANGIKQYCYGTSQNDYTCTDSSTHTFNSNLSAGTQYTFYFYLVDNAGNDNKANLTQKQFTTSEKSIADLLNDNARGTLETIQHMQQRGDTLRRFQGQVETNGATITSDVPNYICFGTDDQATCKDDTDKYMYRIIGIDATTNEIKVIKREALKATSTWGSSGQTWKTSTLQSNLNETLFLKDKTDYPYMQTNDTETNWTKIISKHDWEYGDVSDSSTGFDKNTTSLQAYQSEKAAWKFTLSAKVGLMYASDYYLSGGDNLKCHYNASSDFATCKKSWLHLSNNDTVNLSTTNAAPPSEHEWTMSQTSSSTWNVALVGHVTSVTLNWHYAVRPVFYIDSSMIKLKGTGIIGDPYYITNVN